MVVLKIFVTLFFKVAKSVIGLINFESLNTFTEDLATFQIVIPDLFQFVAYFLDERFFTILIPFELSWIGFKILLAILMRIKSFIPTISST